MRGIRRAVSYTKRMEVYGFLMMFLTARSETVAN